jgi:hypothetical protein
VAQIAHHPDRRPEVRRRALSRVPRVAAVVLGQHVRNDAPNLVFESFDLDFDLHWGCLPENAALW